MTGSPPQSGPDVASPVLHLDEPQPLPLPAFDSKEKGKASAVPRISRSSPELPRASRTNPSPPPFDFSPASPRASRPPPSEFSINTLAYGQIGAVPNIPVSPANWEVGKAKEPFGVWLRNMHEGFRREPMTYPGAPYMPPSEGLSLLLDRDRVPREAHNLIHLARLAHRSHQRLQGFEQLRSLTAGLLETPFVAQALASQNSSPQLKAEREAYLRGATQGFNLGSTYGGLGSAHGGSTSRTSALGGVAEVSKQEARPSPLLDPAHGGNASDAAALSRGSNV